jgi:hypothetical protein
MLISTVSSPPNHMAISVSAMSPLLAAKDEDPVAATANIHSGGVGGPNSEFVSSLHQQHKSPPLRTLSPPHPALPPAPSSHRETTGSGFDGPPALLLGGGHPREGQAASLLGNKYLLMEELEGSSLHRCLHIHTRQEFVCKVS